MRSNEFSGRIERNSLQTGFYADRIASPQLSKETEMYFCLRESESTKPINQRWQVWHLTFFQLVWLPYPKYVKVSIAHLPTYVRRISNGKVRVGNFGIKFFCNILGRKRRRTPENTLKPFTNQQNYASQSMKTPCPTLKDFLEVKFY